MGSHGMGYRTAYRMWSARLACIYVASALGACTLHLKRPSCQLPPAARKPPSPPWPARPHSGQREHAKRPMPPGSFEGANSLSLYLPRRIAPPCDRRKHCLLTCCDKARCACSTPNAGTTSICPDQFTTGVCGGSYLYSGGQSNEVLAKQRIATSPPIESHDRQCPCNSRLMYWVFGRETPCFALNTCAYTYV
jgi:hypothetical protein